MIRTPSVRRRSLRFESLERRDLLSGMGDNFDNPPALVYKPDAAWGQVEVNVEWSGPNAADLVVEKTLQPGTPVVVEGETYTPGGTLEVRESFTRFDTATKWARDTLKLNFTLLVAQSVNGLANVRLETVQTTETFPGNYKHGLVDVLHVIESRKARFRIWVGDAQIAAPGDNRGLSVIREIENWEGQSGQPAEAERNVRYQLFYEPPGQDRLLIESNRQSERWFRFNQNQDSLHENVYESSKFGFDARGVSAQSHKLRVHSRTYRRDEWIGGQLNGEHWHSNSFWRLGSDTRIVTGSHSLITNVGPKTLNEVTIDYAFNSASRYSSGTRVTINDLQNMTTAEQIELNLMWVILAEIDRRIDAALGS